MNKDKIRLAMALIAAMDRDEVARADAATYGNWYEHLTDQMADILAEQLAPPVAA
jgi:hypothetical protein